MKNYSITLVFSVLAVVLLSLSSFVAVANAQYESQQTTNITIGADGVVHVDQSTTTGEVSIDIAGTPGSTGSVSTATYIANPQPTASVPPNITLSDFTAITFDMPAGDFHGATIVIHYKDSDVESIKQPYLLYKYVPVSNSYVQQNAIVDNNAKTITLSVTSPADPLFAIGGASATTESPGIPAWTWILVVVVVVVVILLAVLMTRRRKSPFEVTSKEFTSWNT